MKILYAYVMNGCSHCEEMKPILAEFRRKNVSKVMTVMCDVTHNVMAPEAVVDRVRIKETPTFILLGDKSELLKKHIGVATAAQLEDFVFDEIGKEL